MSGKKDLNSIDQMDNKLRGDQRLTNSDISVLPNVVTQLVMASLALILYLFCRKKAPWLYYPNSWNRIKHPGYSYTGFVDWLNPLFKIKDIEMLAIVGLDSFMLLQVLKLCYRIFFMLLISTFPVIIPLFFFSERTEKIGKYFVRFSFFKVKSAFPAILVAIYVYLITVLIFYFIFIYYKRYVSLRQVYLVNPAAMTSIDTLTNISNTLPQDEDAIEYLNSMSYTVLIERLPSYLENDNDTWLYVEKMGLGEITNVVLIHDTYDLQKMCEERDTILQSVEKEINSAFLRLQKYYKLEGGCSESFGTYYNKKGLSSAALEYNGHKVFPLTDKTRMLNIFTKKAVEFLTMESVSLGITRLEVYIDQLKEQNQLIYEIKESLLNANVEADKGIFSLISKSENSESYDRIKNMSHDLYVHADLENNVSFFNANQFFSFKDNVSFFSLDLPLNTKKAFVTFKEKKSAGIIRQSQIGTRVFGPKAYSAPAPNDILWKNMTISEISAFFGSIASTFFFLSYNFIFYLLVSKIVEMISSRAFESDFLVDNIYNYAYYRKLLQGIIAPMIYNIFLVISPIIIDFLINFEAIKSYSLSQIRLMKLHTIFLFCNAFLAFFFSANFYRFFSSIMTDSTHINSFLRDLAINFIDSGVFFFNTCVQRALFGTAMVVLKPVPFILNFIIQPLIVTTKRQDEEIRKSFPLDFGNIIPQVLLVFPIALAYSCVCPLIIPVGFLFYFANYYVYKNELLYCSRNPYESGGVFWNKAVAVIIISVVGFQIFTFVSIFITTESLYLYLLIPLLILDYYFYNGISTLFRDNCKNYPLNEPEKKFLNDFSKRVMVTRREYLDSWKEERINEEADNLPIHEMGLEDKSNYDSFLAKCYYKDPSVLTNISHIKLPLYFYIVVNYIIACDKNNKFGLR